MKDYGWTIAFKTMVGPYKTRLQLDCSNISKCKTMVRS